MAELFMNDEEKQNVSEVEDEKVTSVENVQGEDRAPDRESVSGEDRAPGEDNAPAVPKGDMERFYENFRNVPLKYLDAFIIFCFVMLIAVIAFGVFKAKF